MDVQPIVCPTCGHGDPEDPDPSWPGCAECTPTELAFPRRGSAYREYGWERYPSCAIADRSDYI